MSIEAISRHLTIAHEVRNQGGKLTPDHDRIAANWTDLATFNTGESTARLNSSILTAKSFADMRDDYDAAILDATATTVARAQVVNAAAPTVLGALLAEYAKTATGNYTAARDAYNTAAKAVTESINAVDPDTAVEGLVGLPKDKADAYLSLPLLVANLEAAMARLTLAAEAAGLADVRSDRGQIGLALDATGLHRRRLWEAWADTDRRGGRWTAVVKLGADLQAPDADKYAPCLEPAAMQVRQIPTRPDGFAGVMQEQFDPEDNAATVGKLVR